MSQASFIVLLLIMWAVVAAIYTVVFTVGTGPDQKAKESAPERRPVAAPTGHHLPHAA